MTRKPSRTSALLILISLVAVAVFSACTQSAIGIFASITQETDINSDRTDAFTDANASFVGQSGSTYYAIVGQGRIYERTLGGDWNTSSIQSGLSDPYAQSAAVANNILYVVFGENNPRIYSYAGTTRTQFGFNPADEIIVRVLAAGTQLFAITEQVVSGNRTGKYFIYSYNGTDFTTLARYDGTVVGKEISLPNSVTTNGTTYWFDAGDKVITGTPGSLDETTLPPSYHVTGVVHFAGDIYASSSSGRILKTADGATWEPSAEFKNSNSVLINFTAPTAVTFGPTTVLLVGTTNGEKQNTGDGYYEIVPSTLEELSIKAISTETNFDTSLNGKSVPGMPQFVEAGGIRVFGLTIKDGLWSNYYNGTTWSGWARE